MPDNAKKTIPNTTPDSGVGESSHHPNGTISTVVMTVKCHERRHWVQLEAGSDSAQGRMVFTPREISAGRRLNLTEYVTLTKRKSCMGFPSY